MIHLTSEELGKLSADHPDLRGLGETALVPFEVTTLPQARVLWLNDRWFSERGLAVQCDSGLRSRVGHWVLDQFAITTTRVRGASSRLVHADRYGDTRGNSPHGGSGRVATVGTFQVKGVGPTPLVGEATQIHSHGLMSLPEAICEAIFGELLQAELPYGAVPVIAILDTGESFQPRGDQGPPSRRALVIRPAVLRPAHLLRAPMFVPESSPAWSAPGADAMRTYAALRYFAGLDQAERARLRIPEDVAELFERLARQAASADALRLFTGGLFAGNVAMDGAILDFGVARSMYSWANMQVHAHAQGFGRDVQRLAVTAQALQFYAGKAQCLQAPFFSRWADELAIRNTYERTQDDWFGKIWSDGSLDAPARAEIRQATRRYFDAQQRTRLRERWDGKRPPVDWIHEWLTRASPGGEDGSTPEAQLLRAVRNALRSSDPRSVTSAEHAWRTAARVLRPRPELDRRVLEIRLERILRDETAVTERRITSFIDNAIGRGRRWWPRLPADLAVISQRIKRGCSALQVVSRDSGERRWWLEGPLCGEHFIWGSRRLSPGARRSLAPQPWGQGWHCLTPGPDLPEDLLGAASGATHLRYGEPPAWWSE